MNEEAQRFDGIEGIGEDGTVYFREEQMSVLKEMLGYDCLCLSISAVEEWAKELLAKYSAFARRYA
jgi:hypothetical protein